MYEKEKEIIDKMSTKRKGKVYAMINCWETPKELSHLKKEIDRLNGTGIKHYEPNNVITHVMGYIESIIGHRKTSYAWWKHAKLDIKSHDEWFNKTYGEENEVTE